MKKLSLMICVTLLALLATVSVFAQTGTTPRPIDNSASFAIVESIPVTASVQVNINGEIYHLAIPVTVNIDAEKDLADALLTAPATNVIGNVVWEIMAITEHTGEYALSQFSTVRPSTGNKIVAIESSITNLASTPFTYAWETRDRYAYDSLGNLYETTDYRCDDLNPGSTGTCLLIFDVPQTATLLGLEMSIYHHKRIPFRAGE